jgi:hypothetical protein
MQATLNYFQQDYTLMAAYAAVPMSACKRMAGKGRGARAGDALDRILEEAEGRERTGGEQGGGQGLLAQVASLSRFMRSLSQ